MVMTEKDKQLAQCFLRLRGEYGHEMEFCDV